MDGYYSAAMRSADSNALLFLCLCLFLVLVLFWVWFVYMFFQSAEAALRSKPNGGAV